MFGSDQIPITRFLLNPSIQETLHAQHLLSRNAQNTRDGEIPPSKKVGFYV